MSIYSDLTNRFLQERKQLPEPIWDEPVRAYLDQHFADVARSVYSNPDSMNGLDEDAYGKKFDKNLIKLYESKGLDCPDNYPLVDMLLGAEFDFPIVNVFGMALANGKVEQIEEVWTYCVNGIWNEFSKCLLDRPGRENTLRLCRLLDLVEEFESVMIDLEFYSSNYLPLCGVDNWFGDVTTLVDRFLTHDDVLLLSQTANKATLAAMHSSIPSSEWLTKEYVRGYDFLVNNPKLPAETVNTVLEERELGVSERVLLHPHADTQIAIDWATEILDSGEGMTLVESLREWYNVRDDGFNNFNSFRSTSKSGKKVISAIKKWCKQNPDEGEEILEFFLEE
ncbi:MAG: hypothetical protein RL590_582 [Actinomycetota bacterium]|jgi:hypothetical protein